MNLKKLAEQKIDELSGKITPEQIMENAENDSVQLVLEGLEDELSLVENTEEKEEELSIELISEDSSLEDSLENNAEISQEQRPRIKKDLFAGYLGELNEAPNPLEYGANATYRNLREGIVYKKGPDNLWEVFVKDGAPGRQGPSAPGGGCGVTEVNNIVENRITTKPIVANYPGSASNPFTLTTTVAELNALAATTYPGHEIWVANPNVILGMTKMLCNASKTAYYPAPGEYIVQKLLGDAPIADVTSAATGLLPPIWASSVIPDYLLPLRLKASIWGNMSVINAAGSPNAMIATAILGSIPVSGNALSYLYPLASVGTPNSSGGAVGLSLGSGAMQASVKSDYTIAHESARGTPERNIAGALVAGQNKLYIMGDSSKIGDRFVVYQIVVQVVGVGG